LTLPGIPDRLSGFGLDSIAWAVAFSGAAACSLPERGASTTVSLESILAKNRINILGGVSDAGKTRFILPTAISDFQRPWAYISGDRSKLDAIDTFSLMGYDASQVPLIPAFGADHKPWRKCVEVMSHMEPRPEYVIFEGFQRQCKNHNRPDSVYEFLNEVDSHLRPTTQFPLGLTLLGIAESPKQKPRERYPDPRHRISGCSAWVSHASTVLVLEPLDNDMACENGARQLWVCGKNSARVKLLTAFDKRGRLLFRDL
jgi:hypothetical protein